MCEKNLVVDKDKCIGCGLCVKDCIAYALELDENQKPQFSDDGEKRCIKCQHCLAVCPVGVISILNKNPQDSDPVWNQNPDAILNLIKSRRSIRYYKQENLDVQTMQKLKDMLNWSPTGCNFHKMHFSFIEDKEIMEKIRTHVNTKLIKILSGKLANGITRKFAHYKNALLNGEDVIFRGAPHMVVVSTPLNAPCVNIDPVIALSYFELYAYSLGIGTCWCGFAQICLQFFPELAQQMKIPDGYKISYVMLFGKPDIRYSRTTQPEAFEMTTVMDFNTEAKVSLTEKIKHFFFNSIR